MPVATIPKTRVVFFNRSYWPDVEATGQLLTELTQDLAEDFDVEVVAGQPNCSNSDDTRLPPGFGVSRWSHDSQVAPHTISQAFLRRATAEFAELYVRRWMGELLDPSPGHCCY